jgi:hypothetical protein
MAGWAIETNRHGALTRNDRHAAGRRMAGRTVDDNLAIPAASAK